MNSATMLAVRKVEKSDGLVRRIQVDSDETFSVMIGAGRQRAKQCKEAELKNRFRLLMELPDGSFLAEQLNERVDLSEFEDAPLEIREKALVRILGEGEYNLWHYWKKKSAELPSSTSTAIVKFADSRLGKKFIVTGLAIADINQLPAIAADYNTEPQYILGWMKEGLTYEEVQYLLEKREELPYRHGFAFLMAIYKSCEKSKSLFEELMEFVEEYASHLSGTREYLFAETKVRQRFLEDMFEGDGISFLLYLRDNDWPEKTPEVIIGEEGINEL